MKPKSYIIPLFVPHYGCPHDCVFCNQRGITSTQEPVNADEVRNAIENAKLILPGNATPELAFYGGSFTAIPENERISLLEAAFSYVRSGFLGSIRVSTRPDCVDAYVLEQLRSYGVRTIELGVQSMDGGVLMQSGRGHTAEDTVRASEMVINSGFNLILQMMTGLPGDSFEHSVYTANEIVKLKPSGVRIYPAVVLHGTALYDMWRRGVYKEHSTGEAVRTCAVLYEIFERADIPVIRMGLNPTDVLTGSGVAAGAYHAAFGELVYSEIMLKRAREILLDKQLQDEITLYVNPSCISATAGHKQRNIDILSREFGVKIRVKPADIRRFDVTADPPEV